MDIGSAPEIGGSIIIGGSTIWLIARQIISYYFKKQLENEKEIKALQAQLNTANSAIGQISFKHLIENLEKDINGLGAKLREFELRLDGRIKELIKLETQNLKGLE